MAFTRDVIVRLPGENQPGDPWATQWTDPNLARPSPGPTYVRAAVVGRQADGTLTAQIDGIERVLQPDDSLSVDYTYKPLGPINNTRLEQLRQKIISWQTGTPAILQKVAEVLQAMIEDNVKVSNVTDIVALVDDTNLTGEQRALAATMVGLFLALEL